MFISRAPKSQACFPSDPSCSSDSDGSTSRIDPSLLERPGAHRYIGIAMVLGLLLIVFFAWLYLGKWPRRILRQYCSCCSKRLPESSVDNSREDSITPAPPISSQKDRRTQEGSAKRVKEVSGGMLVFTQVSNGKDRRHSVEWEMKHGDSIRLETRTPQRHNASRQS